LNTRDRASEGTNHDDKDDQINRFVSVHSFLLIISMQFIP
jgi:hypothetical protein